jgi:uncharacterized membrane protein YjdF
MATQKNKYAHVKLEWAKKQIETWMNYVDANPFDKMEDRTKFRPTKGGGMVLEVVATIEAQQKSVRETVKDYLALLEVVKKLEKEDEDNGPDTGRGGEIIPPRMK